MSPLFIYYMYRINGEKLIKYQANTSYVIMSLILMTTILLSIAHDCYYKETFGADHSYGLNG